MPLTVREFDSVIRKFGFEVRVGDHVRVRLMVNGRPIVRTMRSHQGSGDLKEHRKIQRQLRLSESQLRDAINCPLTREGYLDILRSKGIL